MSQFVPLIEPLPPDAEFGGFRCLDPEDGGPDEIGAYLSGGDAARDESLGLARTFLVLDPSSREVLGYFTLRADVLLLTDGEAIDGSSDRAGPAIKLARLGTRHDLQGSGLGTKILHQVIATALDIGKRIGVRYITIDAVKDKIGWYERRGFAVNLTHAQPQAEADLDSGELSMRFDLGPLESRPVEDVE